MRERDGQPSNCSPETEAMVKDFREISQKKARKKQDVAGAPRSEYAVDGMSDEDMDRVAIYMEGNKSSTGDDGPEGEHDSRENRTEFQKYKHHHYIRRWGLLEDSDGLDEEWFIPSPPVLPEDDPEYLCDMCRHIDFTALFTLRGLPGNDQPGSTSIILFGLAKVMADSLCSFCTMLRRKISEDKFLNSASPEDLEAFELKINVLDDGPDYPLRLEVEIPEVNNQTCRIILQKMEEGEATRQPLRGLFVSQNVVDISRLKSWLQLCDEQHGPQQESEHKKLDHFAPTLRVIDTVKGCVTEVTTPFEYACLSYVWGRGSQTQYTTATKEKLEVPGALTDDDSLDLPQTIKDAFRVTQELGLRYIWIDALCILQDDDMDKAKIISRMGTIYGNATLNIAACTNSDPTDGLPGIGPPRSRAQITEKLQGMTLGVAFHDSRKRHFEIEQSVWNSRAWTFQERLLPRRTVYFTDSQMCFQCPHGTFFEDTVPVLDPKYKPTPLNEQTRYDARAYDIWHRVLADPTQSKFPNKAFETESARVIMIGQDLEVEEEIPAPVYHYKPIPGDQFVNGRFLEGHTPWDMYKQAVNAYTQRRMTWQTDALNAFIGITDLIIQGTNTKFWYGMPEFAFAQSLLWQPLEPLKIRIHDGKPLFPSWTWVAWEGHVSYRGRGWHNAISYPPASVVQWYQKTSPECLIEDFKASGNRTPQEIEHFTARARSAAFHLLSQNSADILHTDYEGRGWTVYFDEARNQHLFSHEAYPGIPFTYPIYLPDQEVADIPADDGSLYFETNVVPARFCDMATTEFVQAPIQDTFFQIGVNDESRSANYRPPWKRILYHQGYRAGFLSLNVSGVWLDLDGQEEYSLVAMSRDGLSHIAPPPVGWDLYRRAEPHIMQIEMFQNEWRSGSRPPDPPNETVVPSAGPTNETGDPHWDKGRFGPVAVYDVYNVLLLKRVGRSFVRIGIGKVNWCAFRCAKPETRLIRLM